MQEAIDAMEYASTASVMFQGLYYSGGRLTCLDKMYRKNLHGQWMYWQPGKRQKGWRKVKFPIKYLEELQQYWLNERVPADKVYGVTGETFRGYFKNFIRQTLPPSWQKRRPVMTCDGMRLEFRYQLKGLRKNYQTLSFKRNLDEWGDPGLAIEMTSKEMLHSSTRITAKHYVENFNSLGVRTLPSLDPAELLKLARQRRLFDYL